jgi:uncharacterized protein (TIGR02145 family)
MACKTFKYNHLSVMARQSAMVILAALLFSNRLAAQSPDLISYQAIIRDASGLVINKQVGLRISILKGSDTGTAIYTETHNVTTNANGLISVKIGSGTSGGHLSDIDWTDGPYFLKTETDPNGGTAYTIIGTSQILSVPYALHAATADDLNNPPAETDPVYSSWNKTTGITITENQITDLKSYLTAESQTLSNVLGKGNSAGNNRITNLADPVDAQDAVTKAFLDALGANVEHLQDFRAVVKDIEGNIYTVVKIGAQWWMGENLKTTYLNDGTPIPLVTDGSAWANLGTPGYCWFNNNMTTYGNAYGALYNWNTVATDKLCPANWHVPSDAEWLVLSNYLGGETVAGGKLKEPGTMHWNAAVGATDESGFSLRAGGARIATGDFLANPFSAYLWSSKSVDAANAWSVEIWYGNISFVYPSYPKKDGFSVRCIKD